jgi:hypothetical protein
VYNSLHSLLHHASAPPLPRSPLHPAPTGYHSLCLQVSAAAWVSIDETQVQWFRDVTNRIKLHSVQNTIESVDWGHVGRHGGRR